MLSWMTSAHPPGGIQKDAKYIASYTSWSLYSLQFSFLKLSMIITDHRQTVQADQQCLQVDSLIFGK